MSNRLEINQFPFWVRCVSAPAAIFTAFVFFVMILHGSHTEWIWGFIVLAILYGGLGLCCAYMVWVLAAITVNRKFNTRNRDETT